MKRWSLIEEIFHSALERPPSERSEYLSHACGDDAELRVEIESLLINEGNATAALDPLVAEDLREMVRDSDASEMGVPIGPYRLVRELDSGGMGVVYLAFRSDDQYFQIVAIKMIRRGLESSSLVQRFRAERQILATLTHPNIGTILDGGDTEDGRPFMVMEYVEGQPITLASENRGLSITQRIELFRTVCSAVHHAHQKLVIHRDIKPSNVLVTPESVVKLIDFGVSKPLYQDLMPDRFPETEHGQRLMTPDYASPEQLLGQQLTTASDTYSLGVLFFELLTGSRPYSLGDLTPAAAERVVCHQEVRRPSSVDGLSDRTRRELRGDLDRIVLMAMDKDPTRRYLSVQHFEEDLLRYLQGRPVLARKATPIYRLSKFVERHRMTTLMTGAIIAVLSGSILIHHWQSLRADRRVREVETLTNSAITDLAEKLEQSPGSTDIQASLFHGALSYLEQLRQDSGNDPRLLLQLSKAYEHVGDLEGSPFVANLGNSGTAVASYQEALRTATEARSRLPGEESTRAVIEAQERLAGMEAFLGNIREARENYGESLSLALDLSRQKPNDPVHKDLLAANYAGIGDVELSSLEPIKALQSFREASQVFGDEPNGNEDHDRMLIRLLLRRSSALNELGSQSEALGDARKAIAIAEGLTQEFPSGRQVKRDLFSACQKMVLALAGRDMMNVGDSRQAQVYARKGLGIAEALAASDTKNMQARYDVSLAYAAMGDSFRLVQPAIAAAWYRKSLSLTKELAPHYGSEARHLFAIRDEALAAVLVGKGHARERLQLLQEANQIRRELAEASPHGRIHLMSSYCKLSGAELVVGNLPQAQQFASSALPFLDEFKPTSPSLLVLRDVGRCYESVGNVQKQMAADRSFSAPERQAAEAEARLWYRRSADVWTEWDRRGVATPESEIERRKVEHYLKSSQRLSP
jgi:serine/threonine protein kinase